MILLGSLENKSYCGFPLEYMKFRHLKDEQVLIPNCYHKIKGNSSENELLG
jgi:hypothetical protein